MIFYITKSAPRPSAMGAPPACGRGSFSVYRYTEKHSMIADRFAEAEGREAPLAKV
jgi:hypothetical protein